MKRFPASIALSLLLSMTIVMNQAAVALAVSVEVPVAPVCCVRQYPVYGEEQPVGNAEGCVVTVEIEPPVDADDSEEPLEPEPLGSLDSAGTALESASAPLRTLYQALPVKNALMAIGEVFFDDHVELYHEFLDADVFGKAISQVSEFQSSQDLSNFLKTKEGICDADDPRPNCVIEYAMCSYEKYIGVLFHQTGQSLANQSFRSSDVQTLLNLLQERDAALYHEAQQTQQALDTAIAVYSQFFNTYQLHLRFKEVIEALVKVRNMTSSMRTLVGCIPNKFVGVATTKCN
ncbi:MAG: hypothetical protein AB7J40_05445 [Candidatus Altimarinota bacterium]